MAKGSSGRVVVVLEPELKRALHAELARRGLTLRAWFIDQATRFLETSRQPSLFVAEDPGGYRPRPPGDIAPSTERDGK